MHLVLLMLSVAVSGWMAWRRSPRYTVKRTAWTVLAMLATGLLVGLAPLWLIPAVPAKLQSAVIPTAIAFVLLVTLGACAVILRVTDGAMAKPRAGASIVRIHRRKVNRIAQGIGLGLLLLAACDLILPGNYRGLGSIMAGFLLFIAIPLYYGLHHKASRHDRAATTLIDKPWTVWRYTPSEWSALADLHFHQDERSLNRIYWLIAIVLGASLMLGAADSGASPTVLLAMAVLSVLSPAAMRWAVRRSVDSQRRRRLAAAHEIRLGPEGLLIGDEYTPWALSGTYLRAAWIEEGPNLILRFTVPFNRGIPSDKLLALPRSSTAELFGLQQHLLETCPHARIALG